MMKLLIKEDAGWYVIAYFAKKSFDFVHLGLLKGLFQGFSSD